MSMHDMNNHFFFVEYTRQHELTSRKKFLRLNDQDFSRCDQTIIKEIHEVFADGRDVSIEEYVVDDKNIVNVNRSISNLETTKLPNPEEYKSLLAEYIVVHDIPSEETATSNTSSVDDNEASESLVSGCSLFNNHTKVKVTHARHFMPRDSGIKYIYVMWCSMSGIKTVLSHFEPCMLPLIRSVLPELAFCSQVYELPPTSKHFDRPLLFNFVRGVIVKLSFEDFKQEEKIDQIVEGAVDIMQLPTKHQARRHTVRPNNIVMNDGENQEQFKRRVVEKFMEQCLKPHSGARIPSHEMQTSFFTWLKDNVNDIDAALFSKNNFTPILKSFGCNSKRTQNGILWMDWTLTY